MEKKIEKLVFAGDLIENELERIRIKINKIIEGLNRPTLINYPINTQPQAGVFTEFTDKNISDDIPKGFVDIDGKLHKFEYNPEKKKDWEERTKKEFFNKFNWDYLFSKETKEIVWDYVKQLLLDREREAQIEVLTEIFQNCYQEDSKTLELVEEKLDKLTTK